MIWKWILNSILAPIIATVIAAMIYQVVLICISDKPDKEKFWKIILCLYLFFQVAWAGFGVVYLGDSISKINPEKITITDVQSIAAVTTTITIITSLISVAIFIFILFRIEKWKRFKKSKNEREIKP